MSAIAENAGPQTVPAGRANYVLAVLFFVVMLNFLDRQIIAILAEPIKQEMGLSDKQIGLMSGLSFALFYTTMMVPVAALADKWNRSWIIAIAIGLWSAMTMACGMAQNFTQMFFARIGVGVGESGSAPASHSLITEYFPPEKRAGALGILGAAVPIGAFVAYAGGGWIVDNFDWRTAFILAGAPGLVLGLIVWLTVKDSRGSVKIAAAFKRQPGEMTLKQAVAELSKKRAYWHLVAAGTLVQFVAYGISAFYGSFYVRVFGISYSELGLKLGIMVGIAGVLGAYLGGKVSDAVDQKHPGRSLLIVAGTFLVAVPGTIAAITVKDVNVSIALFGTMTFAATYYYGPNFSLVQTLANDRTRAMAVAIYLLITGLLGLSMGPLFLGVVSDFVSGGDPAFEADGIRAGVAVTALFNLWTAFHFWRAYRCIRADSLANG